MESSTFLEAPERHEEDLGKGSYSYTTNSSVQEAEPAKRTRNSEGERDYVCPCGKAYLSWPALYTHIKSKHDFDDPKQFVETVAPGIKFIQKSSRKGITIPISMAVKSAQQKEDEANDNFGDQIRAFLRQCEIHTQTGEVVDSHEEKLLEPSDDVRKVPCP